MTLNRGTSSHAAATQPSHVTYHIARGDLRSDDYKTVLDDRRIAPPFPQPVYNCESFKVRKMLRPAWYTTPMCQVVLVGITCFATVGMFSAVTNLGAGGTEDIALADTANGVLYGMFAVTGLVAGGINNLLGPKMTLFLGTLGYALYVGSLWCLQTQGTHWFLVFAGGILGITAALLWSAQGSIMMAYPLEKDKGKAFSIFWAIFQLGTFIGSVIGLAINIRSGGLSAVSTSTYIAFLVIIFVGIASSLFLLLRTASCEAEWNSRCAPKGHFGREELAGMVKLFTDWRVTALLPMFFASNYYYAYQGAVNAAAFDGPTRALNATLEGAGEIIGALMIGFFVLDAPEWRVRIGRRMRGYIGLGVVTLETIIVWAIALDWQVGFTRKDTFPQAKDNFINYHDDNYKGKAALYFFYYFNDACYQALIYWIMSAITNDPFRLARFAGIYKAIQSAGAAGAFGMDAVATPYLNELLASWILLLVSLPLAFLVVSTIKETNYEDEKVVYFEDSKPGDMSSTGGAPMSEKHTETTSAASHSA